MSVIDMNNADQIKEKTNSLNAQKINNINNILQQPQWTDMEKKKKWKNELKKNVSILCKYSISQKKYIRRSPNREFIPL